MNVFRNKFRVGDIVKYKDFHTEYKVVRARLPKYVDIEITKFDSCKITHNHPIGTVFPMAPTLKLELIKSGSARHPLTNIFQ